MHLHSERAHSQWGASSAYRWMACPGSVRLSELAPEQESSPYAAEGTCAHELAERCLLDRKDAEHFIGVEFEGYEVTEEMAKYVQIYVDYVKQASEGEDKDVLIEEKFDLSHVREGMFGSNDACILEHFGTLEVIDLKYGKGIEVEAKNNKQLLYYALGAARGGDFTEVKLTIVQPRVENPIKSWTTSMDTLSKFEEELGRAYDATLVENPKYASGDHCRFCPAIAMCDTKRRDAQATARMDFGLETPKSDSSLPAPEQIDDEVLKRVLDHADEIKQWINSVEGYALHLLKIGKEVPGYKLVKGRANRKVKDEKALLAAMGDEIYEHKLKGIGKLEQRFGKAEIAPYLYKPEPKLTIAPESDKREEVKPHNPFINFDDMEF